MFGGYVPNSVAASAGPFTATCCWFIPRRLAVRRNFLEHHDRLGTAAEEELRIAHHVLDGGQIAIGVEHPFCAETLGQSGLPDAAHPAKSGNGCFAPSGFNALLPERPWKHDGMVC